MCNWYILVPLLLLLSRFSHVQLCATPWTAAYQASPSMGFSRQEHWSGLTFLSPMHESGKWKWSCSALSNSLWLHGLQPTRLLCPWDFPGKSTGVGCHCLLPSRKYSVVLYLTTKYYVVVFWLGCMVCGILVPWPGIEPAVPTLKVQS